jgi:chemotaxis protein methyltransferase CheR
LPPTRRASRRIVWNGASLMNAVTLRFRRVLPDIASRARLEQRSARIWSAGCASGEEPYTLKILWDLEVANSHSSPFVSILATDVDNGMLSRARKGCFEPTSLYELPQDIVDRAFDREGTLFCVKQKHRNGIEFAHQDLRSQAPIRQFDLILCRYVAFTYFAKPLQEATLDRLLSALLPRGYLVIGMHESLPSSAAALTQMAGAPQILQKRTAQND